MPETFIDYKNDKGFWIYEAEMELVFHYIHQSLVKLDLNFKDKESITQIARESSIGGLHGMLVLIWDTQLSSEEEPMMIEVLEDAIATLTAKGTHISLEELQKSREDVSGEYKDYWEKPLKTSDVINVLEIMVKMLKHEWESENHGIEWDY